MRYIASKNPNEALDKAVEFIKSLSDIGEDLQLSFDLDYTPETDSYVIKIKIIKIPKTKDLFPELAPALPKTETEPSSVEVRVPLGKVEKKKTAAFYFPLNELENDLKAIGFKFYRIAGTKRHIPALSLISAVNKWLTNNNKGISDYSRGMLFDLVVASAKENKMLKKEAFLQNFDNTEDELPSISLEDGVEGYADTGLQTILEDTSSTIDKKSSFWGDIEGVIEALPVGDDFIDLSEFRDLKEDSSIPRKHKLASAFISIMPDVIENAEYDDVSEVLNLHLVDGQEFQWKVQYDQQNNVVNLNGLEKALDNAVVATTPFAEVNKPLWRVEQNEQGEYILVPIKEGKDNGND